MTGDPHLYSGTQTLKNNYDIRDPDRLEQAERMITTAAMGMALDPAPDMTAEGLRRIHRHIFGRIYPWAGEFRTIGIEKIVSDDKTVAFEGGPLVRPAVTRFFGELEHDKFLRGLDAGTFAYRAAVYMEDLNFIHPFREGNGRVQRLFLKHLAQQAGHDLDIALIDPRGWMDGSIQSFRQPIDGAHDIMTRTIERAITGSHERDDDRAASDAASPSKDDPVARAIEKVKRKERGKDHDREPDDRSR
jgi:cell filamentation protein